MAKNGQRLGEASPMGKKQTSDNFNIAAPTGYGRTVDGHLAAEDNPEFINQYKDLLNKSDLLIIPEHHEDKASFRWLLSDKHFSVMKDENKDKNYEFLLLELPHEINKAIEYYEQDLIKDDEMIEACASLMFISSATAEPILFLDPEGVIADIKNNYAPLFDGIIRAKEQGIKIRGFDDPKVMKDQECGTEENAHIDNFVHRRDYTWPAHIEEITHGEKAVVLTGRAHVFTSYGIDEFMDKLGKKIGTCQIKNKEDFLLGEKPSEGYDDGSYAAKSFIKNITSDPDGYDPTDIAPDLFYNEQTKELITNSKTYEEAYVKPELEKHGIHLSNPLSTP